MLISKYFYELSNYFYRSSERLKSVTLNGK